MSATPEIGPIARTPLRAQLRVAIVELLVREAPDAGTPLRDTDLARRLGTSRTPVREALLDLVREGLLVADHGRGFRVAPLDPVEARELGQLLGALEALAVRLAPVPSAAALESLEGLLRDLDMTRADPDRQLELNEAWHDALVAGCPNRRLLERLVPLRRSLRRYVTRFLRRGGGRGLATGGPRQVLEALRAGDRTLAASRLDDLLVSGSSELAAWLARSDQAAGSERSSGSR